jgi:hypothetical protein
MQAIYDERTNEKRRRIERRAMRPHTTGLPFRIAGWYSYVWVPQSLIR